MGDGTEAANFICATKSGEGTGAGQCEEPDADSGVTICEWSTDTCIPTAATTTDFTDAWTESKATGMLAPFARGAAALAYDCSAGCTCSAADQATIEAADEGSETMPNVSDECIACLWQVHGNEEAQQQACALPPPPLGSSQTRNRHTVPVFDDELGFREGMVSLDSHVAKRDRLLAL